MWPFGKPVRPKVIAHDGREQLRCSFCGKPQRDVRKLIAGPDVYICDQCVELCADTLTEEWEEEQARTTSDAESSTHGVAVCRLCGLPTSMAQVISVPDRGFLCVACLDAIRAAQEGS